MKLALILSALIFFNPTLAAERNHRPDEVSANLAGALGRQVTQTFLPEPRTRCFSKVEYVNTTMFVSMDIVVFFATTNPDWWLVLTKELGRDV